MHCMFLKEHFSKMLLQEDSNDVKENFQCDFHQKTNKNEITSDDVKLSICMHIYIC